MASPNWRDHFKDFLKFYKDDFEDTSLSTVDGELQLWKKHWKNSKAALPDSASASLKRINFSVSQSSKQRFEYWVQYLLHLVHVKDHFFL